MLDHLTSGRLASGFVRGIGWEYFAQSVNPTRSAERFFEAHDLILKAWTATEPFEWVTRNYEYRYVNIWPRPLQKPYPPIYMAGSRTPDTMRWAAKHRHVYMSVIAPTQSIKGWFNGYRKAAREEFGWEPGPDRFGWVTPTYVGETDKKAVADARGPIEWYFHKSLKQPPGAGNPPGIGVLFVEQHVQFALDLADRAYLMNRGRIALSGAGAELRTRQDLVQASYLGE